MCVTETITLDLHGKRIRFDNRMPEPGEYYFRIDKGSPVGEQYLEFPGRVYWVSTTQSLKFMTQNRAPHSKWRASNKVFTNTYYMTITVLDV